MAIEDWMGTLKTVLSGVTGVRQVHKYDELPGTISVPKSIILLPMRGSQEVSGGWGIAIHQVQATLYLALQVLPEGYGTAVPFIKLVRNAVIANMTLGGLVSYCKPVDPPEFWYEGPGAVRYGDKELLGIIFRFVVKEGESLTVA